MMTYAASVRADDFFTNGDFSQGSAGWTGNFKVFENLSGAPGAPGAPKGLVIQLQPHDWTWLSQEISSNNLRLKFQIKYELSPDAVLSTNPDEYRGIGPNIGDPVRSIHFPRTGVAMVLETNVDQKHRTTLPFILRTGTRRSETVFDSANHPEDYLEGGPTETVTIALPPGTGTVTLSGISATGVDPLAPQTILPPRPPGPPQDTYTQNSDFSQGASGWGGNFQPAAPPTTPAGGLVVQLKPHEWTTLTQDIDIKSFKMTLHCEFLYAADATCSTEPQDYQNIEQKVGLPDRGQAINNLNQMALWNMQGKGFVILTGQDKSEDEFFLYRPEWGYERAQRASFSFRFGVPDNKRTLMLALPPGTGTVTIRSIEATGSAADPNPEAAPSPGAIGNWAVTQVPPAPADDLVLNGDFSEGLSGWKGDLHPNADMPPQTDITLPAAPPSGTGAYFELHKSSWVKVSQDIDVPTPWIKVSIVYAYSSDVTFSPFAGDYENIYSSVGMNGMQRGVPGSGSYFLEDLNSHRGVYSMFNPARRGTTMRIDTVPLQVSRTLPAGKQFAFALPPGKGFVLIYRISIEPCENSPFNATPSPGQPVRASQ